MSIIKVKKYFDTFYITLYEVSKYSCLSDWTINFHNMLKYKLLVTQNGNLAQKNRFNVLEHLIERIE